jgi:hypothetical protein
MNPTIEIREGILFVTVKQACRDGVFESSVELPSGRYRPIDEAAIEELNLDIETYPYSTSMPIKMILSKLAAAGLGRKDGTE